MHPFLRYPEKIGTVRALLYAFMCGDNTSEINEMEMMAGCQRYGVDNPAPVVTKRLAYYGNDETALSILKEMQTHDKQSKQLEPSQYGTTHLKEYKNYDKSRDMQETKEP